MDFAADVNENDLTPGELKAQKRALEELANDQCPNYLKRKRMYGEGDVRIGGNINLGDDIYSIGYVS